MKLGELGNFLLIGAWLLSVYGVIAGAYGAFRRKGAVVRSSENALYAQAVLAVLSLVVLAACFLRHDYSLSYVWRHSNNAMHPVYLVAAVWGGMDGSLLLWAVFTTLFCTIAVHRSGDVPQRLFDWLVPTAHFASSFFLGTVAFLTNPFRPLPVSVLPPDGNGLNPLLQNPSMVIHPPMLYGGFTGLVVPFAFAFATLCSGSTRKSWVPLVRQWTLVAWVFLTAGIVLGGNWAYIELGWGGFWAWDPVENASFLPWLTATAFLHSIIVEERRGMLKVWNVVLAILSYLLAVFGTFLTRSGIVQSVHAFAQTDIGWVFLVYIGVVAAVSLALLAYRLRELKPDHRFESLFSREALYLLNNLLLLGICFATLWGVMFPVLSEALTGEKAAVGPPFFNQVNTPLFLLLLFAMGIGPLVAWRRASFRGFLRLAAAPFLIGSLGVVLGLVLQPGYYYAAVAFGLGALVVATTMVEVRRAMVHRKAVGAPSSVTAVVRSRPRYFGGLIVHLGVGISAIAITAASAFKIERDIVLQSQERVAIGRYELALDEIREARGENYVALVSVVSVYLLGEPEPIAQLHPERRFYPVNEEVTTEVDIRMTLLEDLYVALAGAERKDGKIGNVVLKVFINPLQVWLWFGATVMLIGSVLLLLPRTLPVRVRSFEARAAQGQQS